jgi:hypothetical protein
MAVYQMRCGWCLHDVGAEVVSGPSATSTEVLLGATMWLRCPNCGEGSVKPKHGSPVPGAAPGGVIGNLPPDVAGAWADARAAYSAGAYTASEMMCRKILMHIAVDVAGSEPGKSFVEYVNDLQGKGYITTGLLGVVDRVRQRGNDANHELRSSTQQDATVTFQITDHLLRSTYELPNI